MSLFKKLFKKKPDTRIRSYAEFWDWFTAHESEFYELVHSGENIADDFILPVSQKLAQLRDGVFLLAGMTDDEKAELIFTPDGLIKNVFIIDDIIEAAPELEHWKFSALKPAVNSKSFGIRIQDVTFTEDKIKFYSIDDPTYPDLISLRFTHEDLSEENEQIIKKGIYIYLDHFLGEENFINIIDEAKVVPVEEVDENLIPIEKLEDYLLWRHKEFVEKYTGFRHNTENDKYALLEAALESGNVLMATINSDLLNWDKKASHPWILTVLVGYVSDREDGLPNDVTADALNDFEGLLLEALKDTDGYLNIGRQTCNNVREIFFACKEFRACSRVVDRIIRTGNHPFQINYDLYKDKYWQTFERFEVS